MTPAGEAEAGSAGEQPARDIADPRLIANDGKGAVSKSRLFGLGPTSGRRLRRSLLDESKKNWGRLGSKEAGPKIAATFSIVGSCRKLDIPIRQYLADVLPGLADRSIQRLAALTPTAYATHLTK